MLFPTLNFGLFFLVVFFGSWSIQHQPTLRKLFLLLASYFFYGFWDWQFTLLLFASSYLNFMSGYFISRVNILLYRKIILIFAIAINLSILGFFKYYGFFLETLEELFWKWGIERDLPLLEVIVPVGVSFFTFQGISYIVDVYHHKIEVNHTLLDMMLYISFFPQLVAGPIVRAADFIPQLQAKPNSNQLLAAMGLLLIVWGLFKKAIVANYLAVDLVDPVFFDPTAYSSWDLLAASYGYAVQIYCDFSAYSDIAIGVAALLGYHFPKNFDQPYRAASLREFWQRWHISLSSWLRDYLYIPLGGNQQSAIKTYRNIFITMFLGGLWHGAAWTFIIWGSLHGIALICERFIKTLWTTPYFSSILYYFKVLFVFHFVCLAWIFFRANSLEIALQFFTAFNHWETPATLVTPFIVSLIGLGLSIHFTPPQTVTILGNLFNRLPLTIQGLLIGIIIIIIEAFGMEGVAPFIYFQF
ncbi:MAG: membrane-bound O-acyltransferase family protein [Beggiatoa sp. IS2]|nr:MAG: membrane-bound O-acyltransferase family protein [Beggiatoa sp. IS2]